MNECNKTLEQQIGERIIEKRGQRWTQQEIADLCGVKRETINQWEAGTRQIKAGDLLKLSKALECTVDYLTTAESATTHDLTYIVEKTGLDEQAIKELSDMPTTEEPYGAEHTIAMRRRADTMTYRKIINLLLSNPQGQKALKHLASYFFASPADRTQQDLPAFVLPWEVGEGKTYINVAILTDVLLREYLLDIAKTELKGLWAARNGDGLIYPNHYNHTK